MSDGRGRAGWTWPTAPRARPSRECPSGSIWAASSHSGATLSLRPRRRAPASPVDRQEIGHGRRAAFPFPTKGLTGQAAAGHWRGAIVNEPLWRRRSAVNACTTRHRCCCRQRQRPPPRGHPASLSPNPREVSGLDGQKEKGWPPPPNVPAKTMLAARAGWSSDDRPAWQPGGRGVARRFLPIQRGGSLHPGPALGEGWRAQRRGGGRRRRRRHQFDDANGSRILRREREHGLPGGSDTVVRRWGEGRPPRQRPRTAVVAAKTACLDRGSNRHWRRRRRHLVERRPSATQGEKWRERAGLRTRAKRGYRGGASSGDGVGSSASWHRSGYMDARN